jgi:hypothetical protein
MKKKRQEMNKKESELFDLAAKMVNKDPILRNQSSAMRRAWCEGFMNGKLYFDHLKPKRKWYDFWSR